MNEVLTSLNLPVGAVDLPTLKSVYAQLCSYVHKPLLAEALTTIRGGNVRGISIAEIEYWLDLMNRTQRVLLNIAIGYAPQALFPIEVHRKFGFNTPVGGFFDNSNFIPLQQALGEGVVNTYRTHFEGREPPAESLRWAQSHRDCQMRRFLLRGMVLRTSTMMIIQLNKGFSTGVHKTRLICVRSCLCSRTQLLSMNFRTVTVKALLLFDNKYLFMYWSISSDHL